MFFFKLSWQIYIIHPNNKLNKLNLFQSILKQIFVHLSVSISLTVRLSFNCCYCVLKSRIVHGGRYSK